MAELTSAVWWTSGEPPGLFPPESGRLSIAGTRFLREDGSLFQWRGYSWFLGFLRYCRGEDITSDLRWFRANGINIPRLFGPLPWGETPDYRIESFRFDLLDPFLTLLESYGLRSNWSLAHYRDDGVIEFVQRFYDIAASHWGVVCELVNEPHVGATKPNPALFADVDRHGILTSYGYYKEALDGLPGWPPVLDFGTLHTPRDSAWPRKARTVQEVQKATGKPWIDDEPAKIIEEDFDYTGGKNDPDLTPHEAVWHYAIAHLWTPGATFHCEEGKWGRVPQAGMLQDIVFAGVRDLVWKKIDASWQTGEYSNSNNHDSPVDHIPLVWTYTSLHETRALSVRCKTSEPQAINGWTAVEHWNAGNSVVRLER